MSYMNHTDFAQHQTTGTIQELSLDEVDNVGGGDGRAAAQAAVFAGGALSFIGAAARTAALVPSPFSPALAAFGTVAGLAGIGFAFVGATALAGGGPRKNLHVRPV